MRLLHTSNDVFEEFLGDDIPKYAILSHRWEGREVAFRDLHNVPVWDGLNIWRYTREADVRISFERSWAKIQGCRNQAFTDGLEWVWIDSCCIDKSSSAELSEAINSMFKWYYNAEICYAYLSDVPPTSRPKTHAKANSYFRQSKWFTRGWTLQELLAPEVLVFFDREWVEIESKDGFADLVSDITGIEDLKNYQRASIAQKMSWAAHRETTRVEDRAYSLLGLLGVTMPTIYGEGEEAFIRLQLELLKISDDDTLFAWKDERDFTRGLLAESPIAFKDSGKIVPFEFDFDRPAYSMTNKGLKIESHFIQPRAGDNGDEFTDDIRLFALQCIQIGEGGVQTRLAVRLKYIQSDVYTRVGSDELIALDEEMTLAFADKDREHADERLSFHVKQFKGPCPAFHGPYRFHIVPSPEILKEFSATETYISRPIRGKWELRSSGHWLQTAELPKYGMTAAILFQEAEYGKGKERFILILDINTFNYHIVNKNKFNCQVLVPLKDASLEESVNLYFDNKGACNQNLSLKSGEKIVGVRKLEPVSDGEAGYFEVHIALETWIIPSIENEGSSDESTSDETDTT